MHNLIYNCVVPITIIKYTYQTHTTLPEASGKGVKTLDLAPSESSQFGVSKPDRPANTKRVCANTQQPYKISL